MAASRSKSLSISKPDLFTSLSAEVLYMILSYQPAKHLLNVSETCRRMRVLCLKCDVLWKDLIKLDFGANLQSTGPFNSYYMIYQLLYKSRIILEDIDHCTYSGYVPDWLYNWSALSRQPPLPGHGFFSLPAGRSKKTWGLTDEDLLAIGASSSAHGAPRLERYYLWSDGYDAAVSKHCGLVNFQEFALKRCLRSQKAINKQFAKSAYSYRKRVYMRFHNEHSSYKNVLVKVKDTSETYGYLCYNEPQRIGQDYIAGHLHKSGVKQLKMYVEFVSQLQKATVNEDLIRDIPDCVFYCYNKLRSVAFLRLINPDEFITIAKDYFSNVNRVWKWQMEKGRDHMKKFRDCVQVKQHKFYKSFVENGMEDDFKSLRLYFDGLERIRTWLSSNQWIHKLLDSATIAVLQSSPVRGADHCKGTIDSLKKLVKMYLKSGQNEDYRKILEKVCKMSKAFLQRHAMHVAELEQSIKAI